MFAIFSYALIALYGILAVSSVGWWAFRHIQPALLPQSK
jgi:hypothetical protein